MIYPEFRCACTEHGIRLAVQPAPAPEWETEGGSIGSGCCGSIRIAKCPVDGHSENVV